MTSKHDTDRPPSQRISRPIRSARAIPTDECVPVMLVSRAAAFLVVRDHRARFLYGLVNDRAPVFELLTKSGMSLADAADALAILCEAGVVALAEPHPTVSSIG